MLKKRNRLTRGDFPALSRGVAFHSAHLTLRVLPKTKGVRFAVVVSSKVAPLATRRNSLRRSLYSEIRAALPMLKKELNGAVFLKKGAAELVPAELRAELSGLFVQASERLKMSPKG